MQLSCRYLNSEIATSRLTDFSLKLVSRPISISVLSILYYLPSLIGYFINNCLSCSKLSRCYSKVTCMLFNKITILPEPLNLCLIYDWSGWLLLTGKLTHRGKWWQPLLQTGYLSGHSIKHQMAKGEKIITQ